MAMRSSNDNAPRNSFNYYANVHHRAANDRQASHDGPLGCLAYQEPDESILDKCVGCQNLAKRAETKVQGYLQPKRLHHASVKLAGESEIQVGDGNHLYFINDTDIRGAVKIILAALQQEAAFQDSSKDRTNPSSKLGQSISTLPEFDLERNSIAPRLSAAAEPATTISVPKTFFTHTNWGRGQLSASYLKDDLSTTTTTTILSHGSISEIVWTENTSCNPGGLSRSKSSTKLFKNSPNHRRMQQQPTLRPDACQDILVSGKSSAEHVSDRLEPSSSNASFHKRISRSTDEDSNITSFPELRPRHCTKEWLNPPAEIEQLTTTAPTNDLYNRGVDAHSGRLSSSSNGVWQAPQPIAVPCDHSIFDKDPFYCSDLYLHNRRETDESTSTGKIRPGSSIGSSAHRRRSSQAPLAYDSPWDGQDGFVPRILEKLRRTTQHDLKQQEFPRPDWNVWCAEDRKSLSPDAKVDVKAQSRDSIVKERTMKPQNADNLGIYEALTGSKTVMGRDRHDTCSEDNRPHVCENDMDHSWTGIRMPPI
ncbi:hypothetical protein ED733_007027 [Metarhizium rileyi]|uniref:Uncharacterized protein n=1 Tax=Metarhizium rileyi (strain RCEF 4871) TaxID=1649241 RepID=A0A5C6GI57_METRR|nr:hypothetical protein ED733_007027 [Metarhizium rileyi]